MTLAPRAIASSATGYVRSLVRSTLGWVGGWSGVCTLSRRRPTLSHDLSASSSGKLLVRVSLRSEQGERRGFPYSSCMDFTTSWVKAGERAVTQLRSAILDMVDWRRIEARGELVRGRAAGIRPAGTARARRSGRVRAAMLSALGAPMGVYGGVWCRNATFLTYNEITQRSIGSSRNSCGRRTIAYSINSRVIHIPYCTLPLI